jgi:hypothetical protein
MIVASFNVYVPVVIAASDEDSASKTSRCHFSARHEPRWSHKREICPTKLIAPRRDIWGGFPHLGYLRIQHCALRSENSTSYPAMTTCSSRYSSRNKAVITGTGLDSIGLGRRAVSGRPVI